MSARDNHIKTERDAQSREVSPNCGFSVPDHFEEKNEQRINQREWLKVNSINRSSQVNLVKISHMRYQHEDLLKISTFLRDFGMTVEKKTDTECWYRGYGPDPYVYYARKGPRGYLGGTFEVESYKDLEKAMKIPGVRVASNGIEAMDNAPHGGYIVTILDPEGFPLNLVFGQSAPELRAGPERLEFNDEKEKPRVRKFLRFSPGPAAIHKLGHYGLVVSNFDKQFKFYTENFNLVPSNILQVPTNPGSADRKSVAMFAHIDRGSDLVDHHSIFLTYLPPNGTTPHIHHCSFEVHDYDTQALGHEWLMKKGYELVWGLGRHLIGSQLFDYWWDTSKFMMEHYIDGDVVNDQTPVVVGPAGDAGLAAWGPEVPKTFLD
ncbi:hypothetical protein OIDMADRAFT_48845 [Oidiodendron maius Zn]|uniref:VOC domain-containing protein n=1 Tax=Oidiodendron maius (strain Zn) TaxID=913774 RepID=A0A0C3DCD1_OIDMZ|nr:hypothetical protein OIDMADRAFT_48845 [Oidiodendron maius Zn]